MLSPHEYEFVKQEPYDGSSKWHYCVLYKVRKLHGYYLGAEGQGRVEECPCLLVDEADVLYKGALRIIIGADLNVFGDAGEKLAAAHQSCTYVR